MLVGVVMILKKSYEVGDSVIAFEWLVVFMNMYSFVPHREHVVCCA